MKDNKKTQLIFKIKIKIFKLIKLRIIYIQVQILKTKQFPKFNLNHRELKKLKRQKKTLP